MSKEKPKKVVEVKIPGRGRTQVGFNIANIVNSSDAQIYPTVFSPIKEDMQARGVTLSLGDLGMISFAGTVLQSVGTPIWGWWSDRGSRRIVLALGCFFWAIFTLLTALSLQFVDMLLWRIACGFGLAAIIPTANSLITDYFAPEKRGTAFGLLGLTGIIGVIVGSLVAGLIGEETIIIAGWTIAGWRFVFIIWGILSIFIGLLALVLVKDPLRGGVEPELAKALTLEKEKRYKVKASDYKRILRNRTFDLILLQGVVGTIPWNGILFMVTWFKYMGFALFDATIIFAVIAVGSALGNLFGGWIGDVAARWRPRSGRIIIAQISVFSGIPLTFLIFLLIPMSTDSMLLYIVFGAITGFLISWAGGGCNSPIFSEIFEPEIRSTVFSVDRVFEGSVGAVGLLLVGVLADSIAGTGASSAQIATALGQAMFLIAVIPWILCLIFYTFVYKTYPADFGKMRQVLEQRGKELEKTK